MNCSARCDKQQRRTEYPAVAKLPRGGGGLLAVYRMLRCTPNNAASAAQRWIVSRVGVRAVAPGVHDTADEWRGRFGRAAAAMDRRWRWTLTWL